MYGNYRNTDDRNSARNNNISQDIPEYGSAFVCGKSRFEAEKFHVKNDPIISISCGDEHTGVVTETGRVFMFGSNNWGQLGLGHENNVEKPSCIKTMKHEKVILICCGRNHTILATDSGYIYSFGCNSESQLGLNRPDSFYNTPQKITSLPPLNWKMLSAGAGQSCALSDDGSLYIWGINDNGELGLGSVPEQPIPKKIDLNFKVKFVSCGYYHTAIISKTGKLFTAGSNEYYQLGRDGKEKKFNEVDGLDVIVKYVSCGGGHTLFSTEDGVTYAIGDGTKGQLGLGQDILKAKYPKRIKALDKFNIVKISSGECHSAFVTDKGEILTTGDNRYGKLGLNQKLFSSIQFLPILVEKYQDLDVKLVACGGCHMILVGYLLNNSSEEDYSKENRFSSNSLSLSKTKSFIKSDFDYGGGGSSSTKDYMKSSSKSKNITSSRRRSDSGESDYNPEMEHTFNRTHTLTKDDRFVPLSQTDLKKYARDDFADQYSSKKNMSYGKIDRLALSDKMKKSKNFNSNSSNSSNSSLDKMKGYSSRAAAGTINDKNDIYNNNKNSSRFSRNDYDKPPPRYGDYKSESDNNFRNNNKNNIDQKNHSSSKLKPYDDSNDSDRSLNKKQDVNKKKPFKICSIL